MTDTAAQPIEVFYWSTPNGRKVAVMLEELAVPYRVNFVDINNMEQWTPEYEAISPNHQIPAIRDPSGPGGEPIAIAESAAILMYLGRRFGRFYPQDERQRVAVEQWLMWQISSFGPFLGQAHHFNWAAPEEMPYAIDRYHKIAERLYGVLERHLRSREYVAGDYSIADIAIYCWAARHARHRIDLEDFPSVRGWYEAIGERPAVKRGMAIIKPGTVDAASPIPAWEKRKDNRPL
ncbi:MAG: glutathione S-transferase N-terminal domain-containing protein [Bauldia sp.]|uniref:glutathione S-transferase family protein n=1 Tax=Bauldia sp. TaxID=2575872 RepID=UPI001DF529A7|nr:glutathione S-transferase N-terminal domain-containing protein [Bauldia sp.]MCB1497137.1 glutathione S-transferase N-terminal domain-containing protein [Bauldia sp.]